MMAFEWISWIKMLWVIGPEERAIVGPGSWAEMGMGLGDCGLEVCGGIWAVGNGLRVVVLGGEEFLTFQK